MSENQNLQKPEGVLIIYNSCSQRCSGSYKLTSSELEALNMLRSQCRITYNKENLSHQALLSQLWSTVFPTEPAPENLKSHKWKEIGFQNQDPASDFRGAGVFGLEQILYMSSSYPQEFADIIENSSTYSFAISALNITHILMCFFQLHKQTAVGIPGAKTLDIGLLKTFCSLNEKCLDTVNEIFVGAVVKMHKTWTEMNKKGNLTLMQFTPALLAAGKFVEDLLSTNPKSILDLKRSLFNN